MFDTAESPRYDIVLIKFKGLDHIVHLPLCEMAGNFNFSVIAGHKEIKATPVTIDPKTGWEVKGKPTLFAWADIAKALPKIIPDLVTQYGEITEACLQRADDPDSKEVTNFVNRYKRL